jgi:membrane protein YdbS with pleckstrin-like domain
VTDTIGQENPGPLWTLNVFAIQQEKKMTLSLATLRLILIMFVISCAVIAVRNSLAVGNKKWTDWAATLLLAFTMILGILVEIAGYFQLESITLM